MALYSYDGTLLSVDGSLATSENCCCSFSSSSSSSSNSSSSSSSGLPAGYYCVHEYQAIPPGNNCLDDLYYFTSSCALVNDPSIYPYCGVGGGYYYILGTYFGADSECGGIPCAEEMYK